MLDACTAAVLDGVMRLDCWAALSMEPGAWSVLCRLCCADWWSFVWTVGVFCLLSTLAVPGVWGLVRVIHHALNTSKGLL